MYSPSAELDAYILDYKAQKSLQSSPYSTPNRLKKYHSLSNSKSWLQDVLSMPTSKESSFADQKFMMTPKSADDTSLTNWLDELDHKIAKRFPNVNKPPGNSSPCCGKQPRSHSEEGSDSDKTIELIMTDPQTGLFDALHCASYDSHPNMAGIVNSNKEDSCFCECNDLKAPAWVDDVINENLCNSCIEAEKDIQSRSKTSTPSSCYHTKVLEHSVDLPAGYELLKIKDEKVKKPKSRKTPVMPKTKDKSLRSPEPQTPPVPGDNTQPSHTSPETPNVMFLLERAMNQLHEVKVAVEDNTVSAITSDISISSQVLSDFPTDVD